MKRDMTRRAFERWHKMQYGAVPTSDESERYLVELEQARWDAWQAAFPKPDERYPGADTDATRERVEGNFLLRDWIVERYGPDRIRVLTPPRSGVRESHMAERDGLDGDGFFILANALFSSSCSLNGIAE